MARNGYSINRRRRPRRNGAGGVWGAVHGIQHWLTISMTIDGIDDRLREG